ncbi:MAG: hypothetical protein KC983_00715 [Phycisphaerales bacterium]|nr:hypothetical protein [Phycisphaerales bacterium]
MRLIQDSDIEIGTDVPSAVMADIARRDLQRLFQRHLASWASDAMAANRRHATINHADVLNDVLNIDIEVDIEVGVDGDDAAIFGLPADRECDSDARPARRRAA